MDVIRRGEFTEEKEAIFKEIEKDIGREILEMSTVTEEGVMEVKNNACELLLQHRVEHKFKSKKVETVLNRLHVAEPVARDNKVDIWVKSILSMHFLITGQTSFCPRSCPPAAKREAGTENGGWRGRGGDYGAQEED